MRDTSRHRRKPSLQVESLESMTLLSGMTAVGGAATAAPMISTLPIPIIVGLNGTTHGRYTVQNKIPDVGTTYSVNTAGRFTTYGPASVTGSLHAVGFIARGQATGTLQVVFAQGTLTIKLTGPTQRGFSPLPKEFSYVITKGTGKFHNAVGDPVGRGTVDVILKPTPSPLGAPPAGGGGRITLVFHSLPVPLA